MISERELDRFNALLERHGWRAQDFDLQAEVYRLGPGFDWLAEFSSDLERGRFGKAGG